ncbi:MAG: hypothetical protein ACRCST_01320 [Turicibacter sp.]
MYLIQKFNNSLGVLSIESGEDWSDDSTAVYDNFTPFSKERGNSQDNDVLVELLREDIGQKVNASKSAANT